MIQAHCPTCDRSYEIARLDDLPWFPFCSERCRLIDLGRWIDEKHALPVAETSDGETGLESIEDEQLRVDS
jgi:endogenous inhibitor of DNA gyrase (YacG/DUF329 family)